jgi:transketolase
VPNVNVVRPADANETALAWSYALRARPRRRCSRSRARGAVLDPSDPRDAIERGAYVLRDSYRRARPVVILIATGSEVSLCLEAAELLEATGSRRGS